MMDQVCSGELFGRSSGPGDDRVRSHGCSMDEAADVLWRHLHLFQGSRDSADHRFVGSLAGGGDIREKPGQPRTGRNLAEQDCGFVVALLRNGLQQAQGLREAHPFDLRALQGNHSAPEAVHHGVDGRHAQPGGQNAVEG